MEQLNNIIDAEIISETKTAELTQEEQILADTTHEEKIALANYSKNINLFVNKLEDLNGQAAKRVLLGLCSPGVNWVLHRYTTQLEKEVFDLAAKLMDSKILMMLAELEKSDSQENTAIAQAAQNNAMNTSTEAAAVDNNNSIPVEGNTNG